METVLMVLPFVGLALGVVSRTWVPYLQALRDNPDIKFDKKFLLPALISALLNLFLVPAAITVAGPIPSFAAGYVLGWGLQDISRAGQKLYETMRKSKEVSAAISRE